MSVRVNLLPQATRANVQATRQRAVAGVLFLLLLLLLLMVFLWQRGQINDAQDRLAQEELVEQGLRNEVVALTEYRELAEERDAMVERLVLTMGREISFAGLLQDFAAGMNDDVQLDTLTITVSPQPELDPVTRQQAVATFLATGQSEAKHAPGVERLLLSLDRFETMMDIHLTTSTIDDREDGLEDVALYEVDGRIGEGALTGRYAEGLPEELR